MLTRDDIVYFILTDRFCNGDKNNDFDVDLKNPRAYHGGDFRGILNKIPYLKNLGITALWITPVYKNIHLPQRNAWGYHGYWALDFETIDERLYTPVGGRPAGSRLYLRDLSAALHEADIKLILDMVVNHTGYNHPGLKNDPGTKIKSYWFNDEHHNSLEEGRLAGLPDLDLDHPEVIDYFITNIVDWIQDGNIDCIRMDTVRHVERTFWKHYKTRVKGKFPNVTLLGELQEWNIGKLAEFQKHFGFDSLFDFPLQKASWDVFIHDAPFHALARPGLAPNEIPGVMDQDHFYADPNRLVTLLDNHDLSKRFVSEAVDRYGGDRKKARRAQKLAFTFMMTTRGIPQIYYGNEIGLEGYADPDNRRDMPWDVFGAGLEPHASRAAEADTFSHLRKLIKIRKESRALRFGGLAALYSDQFVYVYLREFRGEAAIVALHNGYAPMPVPLFVEYRANHSIPPRVKAILDTAVFRDVLNEKSPALRPSEGRFSFQLPPKSGAIYRN